MIEIENLTKRFGERTVLDDVSLSVRAGEILAVVGPSGAGKSTLSRCVSFLERPTSGTVRVDGKDFTRLERDELVAARRRIGISSRPRRCSVAHGRGERRTAPRLPRCVTASATRRVAELLDRVGLADRTGDYPLRLSGGQQQRVGIARALALGPSMLLSDEATSGLDPATTTSVVGLLRDLRDDLGLSIILITHEIEVVREIADSVARLEGGRIIESGSVTVVLLDPASSLAAELLPDRPVSRPARTANLEVSYAARDVPMDG